MNRIFIVLIAVIFILIGSAVYAAEKEDKYLLSGKSYEVLTDARELMEKKEFTTAESRLNKLLNSDISNYEKAVIYQTLGYIYISLNQFDEATGVFIKSLKDDALPPEVAHSIEYNIAQLLAQAGKYKDSLEYLTHWFEKEKSPDTEAQVLIASLYYQLEDYSKMIPHIQSAINDSTKPQKAWYEMLLSGYYQINELNEAASLLEKMVKLYPDSTNYWLQLAAIYYRIKNYNKALAIYRIAYTKGILDEENTLRLANLYLNAQLPYQAGKLLDENIQQGKMAKSVDNLKLLANSWSLAREYDRAISALLELAGENNDPDTYFRIGQLYFQQQKWHDAVTMLGRASKNNKLENKAEAFLLLGIAAYHDGEKAQSAEALKKAVSYKNTKEQAEWWLNKLEKESGEPEVKNS